MTGLSVADLFHLYVCIGGDDCERVLTSNQGHRRPQVDDPKSLYLLSEKWWTR